MTNPEPRILHPDDPAYSAGDGATKASPARAAASRAREAIRRKPGLDRAYRTGVKVVGGSTVGLGIILIPLPGPGTLVALGGLAILGTESERARKLNHQGVALAKKAAATVQARRAAQRAAQNTHQQRASQPDTTAPSA